MVQKLASEDLAEHESVEEFPKFCPTFIVQRPWISGTNQTNLNSDGRLLRRRLFRLQNVGEGLHEKPERRLVTLLCVALERRADDAQESVEALEADLVILAVERRRPLPQGLEPVTRVRLCKRTTTYSSTEAHDLLFCSRIPL